MVQKWSCRGIWLHIDRWRDTYRGIDYAVVKLPREWAGEKFEFSYYCPGMKHELLAYGSTKGLPRISLAGNYPASAHDGCGRRSHDPIYNPTVDELKVLKSVLDKNPECKIVGYNYSALEVLCTEEGKREVIELCPDGSEKRWKECINNEWIEKSQPCPECIEGTKRNIKYCEDGVTPYSWEVCINKKWTQKAQPCPECIEDAYEELDYCSDGTVKHWRTCINGKWIEDTKVCPQPPPPAETKCIGSDLFELVDSEWQLVEEDHPDCIVPHIPPEEPQEVPPEEPPTFFEEITNMVAEMLDVPPEKAKSYITLAVAGIIVFVLISFLGK